MKLLIIEDEKELAASIASYLKNENYNCEIASNFKQALDKIETSDYECIALDITLPGGSGMQFNIEINITYGATGRPTGFNVSAIVNGSFTPYNFTN